MKVFWLEDSSNFFKLSKREKDFLRLSMNLTKSELVQLEKLSNGMNRIWTNKNMQRSQRAKVLNNLRKYFIKKIGDEVNLLISEKWLKPFIQDKENELVSFKELTSLFQKSDNFARATLSILWKTKSINLVPEIDLSSITDEPDSDTLIHIEDVRSSIVLEWDKLNMPNDEITYWESISWKPLWSMKSGPIGPASPTAVLDWYLLSKESKAKIKKFVEAFGFEGKQAYSSLSEMRRISDKLNKYLIKKYKKKAVKRLCAIADYYGKTRVVAIADHWTQWALKPIGKRLFNLLRSKKLSLSDCTFNHNMVSERISSHLKDKRKQCFSFDLTCATDRLPVSITTSVLSMIWHSEECANNWFDLVATDMFHVPVGASKAMNNSVLYGAGQPMGLNSSWPAFALTHHAIVRYCGLKAGFAGFEDYIMIGDDLIIFNSKVALVYNDLMSNLGCKPKITYQNTSSELRPVEIAKRYFRRGIDITPISLKLLEKGLLPTLLSLRDRGYEDLKILQVLSIPETLSCGLVKDLPTQKLSILILSVLLTSFGSYDLREALPESTFQLTRKSKLALEPNVILNAWWWHEYKNWIKEDYNSRKELTVSPEAYLKKYNSSLLSILKGYYVKDKSHQSKFKVKHFLQKWIKSKYLQDAHMSASTMGTDRDWHSVGYVPNHISDVFSRSDEVTHDIVNLVPTSILNIDIKKDVESSYIMQCSKLEGFLRTDPTMGINFDIDSVFRFTNLKK
jgi:hypothetical protein